MTYICIQCRYLKMDIVFHWCRLTKQDVFWVTYAHFWSKLYFQGSLVSKENKLNPETELTSSASLTKLSFPKSVKHSVCMNKLKRSQRESEIFLQVFYWRPLTRWLAKIPAIWQLDAVSGTSRAQTSLNPTKIEWSIQSSFILHSMELR